MYNVEYKYPQEISEQYTIIGELEKSNFIYECILVNGENPVAIVLKTDIPAILYRGQPLKNLIRCYIIKDSNVADVLSIPNIIDRYR